MYLRANRENLKKYGRELLGVDYSPEKERELINLCTKKDFTDYYQGREHKSFPIARHLEDINHVLGTFGVESCYPDIPELHYCNSGDTYNITILYYKDKLYIGDWGSIAEKYL